MKQQAVLEIKHLTKTFGLTKVVQDLSLTVNRGEIFGLLGPNGAGKTTAIRMIVGLASKTEGTVVINNIDTNKEPVKAMKHVGAIVENPEMYHFLTGYQNLMQFSRIARTTISKQRIDEVIQLVELKEAIHKKVKSYSLGMRQRLGLAQAIIHKPSLLILDEPTNGLDPEGIYRFREYLNRLARQGTSILVSSHLLSEMQLMCDRVAVIQQGKLVDIKTVDEMTASDESRPLVIVHVDDPLKAKKVLETTFPDNRVSLENSTLHLDISKNQMSKVNKTLAREDLEVYEIYSKKRTLEDSFLEMTKSEGGA